MNKDIKICVVGLGYVGLPLASLLSKHFSVTGFDINEKKVEDLKNGVDETGEVEDLKKFDINFSSDPKVISDCNFIIVAVPTPIADDKTPDLSFVQSASEVVGKNLSKGSTVVFESTVYPGCTEEECLPILEKESGLKYGEDFHLGYSPERVNPGDKKNTIDKITKIISADTPETLELLEKVYGSITEVFKASSIKVAEAAKVIENVQRSLNIALMNELALIFDKVGISTRDVLDAAGTKWNFHKYTPGLVGGHCIGIDPYYLTHKAKALGYDPNIILSGQAVNEAMAGLVAEKFAGKKNILVMGLTFKENVPDTRNSKARDVINLLERQGSDVFEHDPLLEDKKIWPPQDKLDGILVFSPHDEFKNKEYSLKALRELCSDNPLLFDVKAFYDQDEAQELGFEYKTL